MSKPCKKMGKGLLWGIGSFIAAIGATAAGWIIYSRKYVRHDMKLDKAIDAERKDFHSDIAGRISYYVDSSTKGVPLVLLHSVNAAPSAFEMKPIFNRFRDERPVYALDLPGFGFSERSDRIYSSKLYQNAISDFLRDVVGEPADVVTLSLSSEFAALSAAHDPEHMRSMVMISPTGFESPKPGDLPEQARQQQAKNTVYSGLAVGIWNRPLYDLVSSRPSIQYFLNKSFEGIVPESFVDYAYQTSHQPGAQFAPTYFLSGKLFTPAVRETVYNVLDLPVLVIYDRDPYTNFEMLPLMVRENNNWTGERIAPTKGLPHWEMLERTFKTLESFWSEI